MSHHIARTADRSLEMPPAFGKTPHRTRSDGDAHPAQNVSEVPIAQLKRKYQPTETRITSSENQRFANNGLRALQRFRGISESIDAGATEPRTALIYEEALHSYFAIADIHQVSVSGLEGTAYIDKTDGFRRKHQGSDPLRITKETDQVHVHSTGACVVRDPVWNRQIIIDKSGSNSTGVWNPWAEKAAGMVDMTPDGWKEMICVETSNAADDAIHLPAGGSHTLTASIRVE